MQRAVAHIEMKALTARRAALIIAVATIVIAVAGGVLGWLVDRDDFPTLGSGLWWSLQTVTTVGYGDIVPARGGGRVIGGVIMLAGIAFVAVVTAAVTAALIESARRRRTGRSDTEHRDQLDQISMRLAAIEQALSRHRR